MTPFSADVLEEAFIFNSRHVN